MGHRLLLLYFLYPTFLLHAYIIQDPKLKAIHTAGGVEDKSISFAYNPYSIYVPSQSFLAELLPDKVMDMGASAYVIGHYAKALYFYMSIVDLFPSDIKVRSWAYYEIAYIYFKKRKYDTSVEYFAKVQDVKGAPVTVQNLAKKMALRIVNRKEYLTLRKQENFVFQADRKARRDIERQITKEEREAEALQRKMARERKKAERIEKRAEEKEKKSSANRIQEKG